MGGGAFVVAGGAALAIHLGSGRSQARPVVDGSTLNRGNGSEPDTLDPHKASGNWENNIIGDMFIGLATEDARANPMPGAALRYVESADGTVYTFQIREHDWSDGTPVTAHDFVYSLRRMLDPKTAAQYASILYPIKNAQAVSGGRLGTDQLGVRAIDDRTLEIAFEYQVPYIAQLLTHYATFAVPTHVVEKHGADWTRPENIVVNGPYILKEWVPNEHLLLVKNPHYYDSQRVKIERVYYYPTQDSQAALKRFRAGEFDVLTDTLPPQQIDWLKANLAPSLRLAPFILSQYVQFNLHRAPFDDIRVRTALSLAIDREIIASKIERAGERPAYAFVPPGIPGYQRGAELRFRALPMDTRIAQARQLLKEAGFGSPNSLSFGFNTQGTTEAKIIAVALQAMWASVGVDAQLVVSDSQLHYNLLRKHDFSVAWAGWIADYRDAKNYLTLAESTTQDLNYSGYANPKFDALMVQSDHTRDPRARAALLSEAEQLYLDAVAVAPVFFGITRDLVSPQVQGWVSNNVNINRTRFLSLDRAIATV
jgi:oligopeptide transport system substrate-binding protein